MAHTDDEIVGLMYQGEANRNASSKVRGYLFQDLVAIEELLKGDVSFVCTEYLEDVFIQKKDEIKIIQVKYYPKTPVNLKEIMRDLYYQYLRLKVYGFQDKIISQLSIHTNNVCVKPNYDELKKYIGQKSDIIIKPNYDEKKLDGIHKLSKNESQTKCFESYAYKTSMDDFLNSLKIEAGYKAIGNYRLEIENKIDAIIKPNSMIVDDQMRKKIAVGLAIRYIQDFYNDDESCTSELERKKCIYTDFVQYLTDNTVCENEESIGAYLQSLILEIWEEIEVDNTDLSTLELQLLHNIVNHTALWIYGLCKNVEGQYMLLNTISRRKETYIKEYKGKSIVERLTVLKEHRSELSCYLGYLWKIMFNINHENCKDDLTDDQKERLKPQNYINTSEAELIVFKFKDQFPKTVLFSGKNEKPKACIGNLFDRMQTLRPEVWYWKGDYKGEFTYDQSVSDIISENSVSALVQGKFRIECMDCITTDVNEWIDINDCDKTIFCSTCIKEMKK